MPAQIGPYRPAEEIGRGGMSVVYAAIDSRNGKRVALKVLPPEFAHNPTFLNRFVKEGENAAKLRHPNIVHTFEAGQAREYYFIAMELAQKGTLADRMKASQSMLPEATVVDVLRQAAAGLDHAHSLGMVHRDIKPSNIIFAGDGRAMISDFGVAKELTSEYTQVTTPGFSVGTPAYMAPEQARGDLDLDRRADIYSLGVVAYAMLTGKLPFEAPSQLVLLRKIVDDMPKPADEVNPNIHPGAAYVLGHVLAKDPDARYQSAGEFVEQLALALAQPRWESAGGMDATVAMIPITPGSRPPSYKSAPPSPTRQQPAQRATPPLPYVTPPPKTAPVQTTSRPAPKKANRLPLVLAGLVGALVISGVGATLLFPGLLPFLPNRTTAAQAPADATISAPAEPVSDQGVASAPEAGTGNVEVGVAESSPDAQPTDATVVEETLSAVSAEQAAALLSQLSEPGADALLADAEATFAWQRLESLAPNEALELVFWPAQSGVDGWQDGIAPAGIHREGSDAQWQVVVDMQAAARIYGDDLGPGAYLWGVVRVEVQPDYRRIGLESEARSFTYRPDTQGADVESVGSGACAGALCSER